jgi:hypothetical protein
MGKNECKRGTVWGEAAGRGRVKGEGYKGGKYGQNTL